MRLPVRHLMRAPMWHSGLRCRGQRLTRALPAQIDQTCSSSVSYKHLDVYKRQAQESARATEDISAKVALMQGDVAAAGTDIENIARVIREISEYQGAISAAVDEQNRTTGVISATVLDAAQATGRAAESAGSMAGQAATTSADVGRMRESIDDLVRLSGELHHVAASLGGND